MYHYSMTNFDFFLTKFWLIWLFSHHCSIFFDCLMTIFDVFDYVKLFLRFLKFMHRSEKLVWCENENNDQNACSQFDLLKDVFRSIIVLDSDRHFFLDLNHGQFWMNRVYFWTLVQKFKTVGFYRKSRFKILLFRTKF